MTAYVYSTASTNVAYAQYGEAAGNAPRPVIRRVVVKGGANVANKHVITPYGIATQISDEDAAFLATDPNFLRHQKAGHVKLEFRRLDPEVVAGDMQGRDRSAPLVEGDYPPGKAPKVSTVDA